MVAPLSTQIDEMLERMRAKRTPEQVEELRLKREQMWKDYEEESRRRNTCSECKVDLRHGSHSFRCYWRGM